MGQANRHQSQFSVASQLLHSREYHLDLHQPLWSNLGYWQTDSTYTQACELLAQRLAEAVQLTSDHRLLDLGCGQGASVGYWQKKFGVKHVVAMDIQQQNIEKLQNFYASNHQIICLQGAFDQPHLPRLVKPQSMQAVVCLDAAYHASSAGAFINFSAQALQPSGHLAFFTLVKSEKFDDLSLWRQKQHLCFLKMANIPTASVLTVQQLSETLGAHQLEDIRVQNMSPFVMHGFAKYVEQHQRALSWFTRQRIGWKKIMLTARLCHFLSSYQAVDYVLVSAVKKQTI